jgi:putative ABC transport system substrate-binding protein
VVQGFVDSLAHPGGNMTGFSVLQPSVAPKWVELLKEISPSLRRVAVLMNPDNSGADGMVRAVGEAAPRLGVEVSAMPVRSSSDIESALAGLAIHPDSGFVVPPDPATAGHRKVVVDLAARHRLPAIYALRSFAVDGGLASYGINLPAVFGRAAGYVDQMLRGERAADLPVQRPTTFELVLNLRAAKATGIAFSTQLLRLADELIE